VPHQFFQLQAHYLHDILEPTPPFDQASHARIADAQSALAHLYAKCVTDGDLAAAQRYLKLNLREHIAWERDTVWRQMIGHERRGEGGTLLGATVDTTEEKAFEVRTRVGRVRFSRRNAWVVISALVFAILLNVSVVEGDEANRCFAVLVFATLLWATEVRQSSFLCRLPSDGVLSLSLIGDTTFRNFHYGPCLTCLVPCDP
jgi:phosphate transporter